MRAATTTRCAAMPRRWATAPGGRVEGDDDDIDPEDNASNECNLMVGAGADDSVTEAAVVSRTTERGREIGKAALEAVKKEKLKK
ncbi:hypothetical protein BHE74_00043130 [Ensete ventricosum]|nr:hypothetical protein BHE74_00043130 [Ensete ventricosum]